MNRMMRILSALSMVIVMGLVMSCGGGGGGGGGLLPVISSVQNTAPVANAGTAKSVSTGSLVTLDGSASSDAGGNPLTYSWSVSARPAGSNAVLSSAAVAKPTFVADVAGTYIFNLIVNNGKLNSAVSSVTITAQAQADLQATGIIKKQGITGYMYGTHVLQSDSGATLYALKSDSILLDFYVDQKVTIRGSLISDGIDLGPKYLNVTQVTLGTGGSSTQIISQSQISATATAANETFRLESNPTAGYEATISGGFKYGADKIQYPAGTNRPNPLPGGVNDVIDGKVDLTWSVNGKLVVIHLTGLDPISEGALSSSAADAAAIIYETY